MRKRAMELLLQMGIPANIQGFHYICDAMEIYEKNESRITTKLCVTYQEIAEKNQVSPTSVERCIRHALGKMASDKILEQICGAGASGQNRTNGNLLTCLYLKLRNDTDEK